MTYRINGADDAATLAAENVFDTAAEATDCMNHLRSLYPAGSLSVEKCPTLKPDPAHDTTGNGTESHYDLAQQLEMRGYCIHDDTDDLAHSFISFGDSDEIIGDIHGDDDGATVTNRK
jgi:hypothetical protein